jgi:hypothetical protein
LREASTAAVAARSTSETTFIWIIGTTIGSEYLGIRVIQPATSRLAIALTLGGASRA